MRTIWVPLALAALMLVPVTTAAETGAEDAEWRHEARDLQFQLQAPGFDVRSARASELGEDVMDVVFNQQQAKLDYRFSSTEAENRSVIDMQLSVLAVIEYRDLNGDGRIGLEDEIVQRVPLSALESSPVQAAGVDGGGHIATSFYAWPSDEDNSSIPPIGGQPALGSDGVTLTFIVSPVQQTVRGVPLTPTEIKFDIGITGFPYTTDDSLIAVETRLLSANGGAVTDLEERNIAIPDGFFRGFYSWREMARIDGVLTPVKPAVVSSDEGLRTVSFSYGRGDIQHDPSLGVMRFEGIPQEIIETIVKGDAFLYTIGGVVAAVAVGLPTAARLRQRP